MLAVGTLEPRKNLPRLVDAYAAFPSRLQAATRSSVVGAAGLGGRGRPLSALHSLGERCIDARYVSDAALAELYRRCAVFCYPSLGEGFGLPVLEAMAAGAAVLTSERLLAAGGRRRGGSVRRPDASGEHRGCSSNRCCAMSRAAPRWPRWPGHERAREFSWERFAQRTLRTLEQAVQE